MTQFSENFDDNDIPVIPYFIGVLVAIALVGSGIGGLSLTGHSIQVKQKIDEKIVDIKIEEEVEPEPEVEDEAVPEPTPEPSTPEPPPPKKGIEAPSEPNPDAEVKEKDGPINKGDIKNLKICKVGERCSANGKEGASGKPIEHKEKDKKEDEIKKKVVKNKKKKKKVYSSSQLDSPPKKISGHAAAYPVSARSSGVEGAVVVRYVVTPSGGVAAVKAVRGPSQLRTACESAVRSFRFTPGMLDGTPVPVIRFYRCNFRLK